MPKPYSQDLRARVVSHVEAGHSRRAAAAHFGVSVSFVVNLIRAYREGQKISCEIVADTRSGKSSAETSSRRDCACRLSRHDPACSSWRMLRPPFPFDRNMPSHCPGFPAKQVYGTLVAAAGLQSGGVPASKKRQG